FDWLDRSSDEVIGIFDEAHNLEDAAREHSSRTLTQETLERAELELAEEGREAEEAREVVEAFREAVENAVEGKLDFGQAERLGNDWEDVTVELDEGDDYPDEVTRKLYSGSVHEGDEVTRRVREGMKLASRLDRRYEREYKSGDADKRKECPSLSVFSFIRDYLEKADEPGYLPIAGVRRSQDGDGVETRLELYTCIPREVMGDLFDSLHS
ncbi:MAG: ATP-dependent DNA helicase, partial [Halobacteria archaeon]|nr:ATP-dependent DNA helicase [Halobacteria archaeon]